MELAFADRIDTDLERLMVINRKPTDNPVIDRVLERIIGSEDNSNARALIATLSEDETATIQEHALADRCNGAFCGAKKRDFFKRPSNTCGFLERRLTWRHVARDDILFRQGEPSDGLFVVVSGRFRELTPSIAGEDRTVGEITQGETVGATGVFTNEIRTTMVVAVRDSILLEFSRDHFSELAARYPRLNEWIARLLSVRLRGILHESPSEHLCTNILLVPASDGAPLEEFANRLVDALSRHTVCFLVSSTRADTLLGTPGIAQSTEGSPERLRVSAWLNEQEARFRYMIYVADPGHTNWTRLCARQADEIVSIGIASAAPKPTEVEMATLRSEQSRRIKFRKTLVLVHPPGTARPQGTIHWLNERDLDRYFHVRDGNRDDLDRIVRYVMSCEIGLVLSGGGSGKPVRLAHGLESYQPVGRPDGDARHCLDT